MTTDGPLFKKFNVTRADGKSEPGQKHHGCDYFVLDVSHDPFAKAALAAYRDACMETHPELASDLFETYDLMDGRRALVNAAEQYRAIYRDKAGQLTLQDRMYLEDIFEQALRDSGDFE